ncbi:hypothetical protein DNI29_19940 [Hymenobacter sediminis]|uniref:O-antigen ligase family protein n=1 Tax=Hymenobacter sediminis TaxID=2218621 RepID=UPI000DA66A18|nr:O-antigen ligase family protein [Hymenobacter sediminis]RPD44967.1 hypothetical protein DNI29_19940 [Hymenobacter sediminis]
MKINFRFLLLLPLLVLLLTDPAFLEFITPDEETPLAGQLRYALLGFGVVSLVLYGRRLPQLAWRWLLVVLLAHGLLALESYAEWGAWMAYPHVFSKLTDLLTLLGFFAFYYRFGLPPMGTLMVLLLTALFGSLLLNHPEALSLGAFLENERGFTVTSAYLFLLPALYYLNRYFAGGGVVSMLVCLGCLAMILFLQHRTVWLSTILALLLTAFLARRIGPPQLLLRRLTPLLLVPMLLGLTGGLAVVLDDPQVLRKLSSSLDDIQHVDKQGTGSWRLKQFEAYVPFILERPVAGWRNEGFELPVQFYGSDDDAPVWEDRTGHHFHSFYMDRLFYFGILGVLLAIAAPFLLVVRFLRRPGPIPPVVLALVAFSGSSLQYGFSFDWPLYLYGLLGLGLASVALVPTTAPAAPPASPTPPASLNPSVLTAPAYAAP